jgi:hypothetical protein
MESSGGKSKNKLRNVAVTINACPLTLRGLYGGSRASTMQKPKNDASPIKPMIMPVSGITEAGAMVVGGTSNEKTTSAIFTYPSNRDHTTCPSHPAINKLTMRLRKSSKSAKQNRRDHVLELYTISITSCRMFN